MWPLSKGLCCRFPSQSLRCLPIPSRFVSQLCSSTEKPDSNLIDRLLQTWQSSKLSHQDHNSKLEEFESANDVWPSPWFGRSKGSNGDPASEEVLLASLDEKQKEAVVAPSDQPLYIEAAAGTGKTTVIQRRLLYLVTKKNVDPSCILTVGFSSRGVEKLRAGVKEHAPSLLSLLSITTLQSLSYAIILRHHLQAGFPNPPTVVEEDELHAFVCKAWFACNPRDATLILQEMFPSMISSLPEGFIDWRNTELNALWNKVLQAEGHSDISRSGREKFFLEKCTKCSQYRQKVRDFQRFIKENKKNGLDALSRGLDECYRKTWLKYHDLLRANSVIASDDMIMLALRLLRRCPDILKMLRERFSHLLLDDFEDTSRHQLELCLIFHTPFVTIASDNNQSVYQFRDAIPNALRLFKIKMGRRGLEKHTEARLEINHRSSPEIVAFGSSLLQEEQRKFSHEQSSVMASPYRNSEDQAQAIAARLLVLHSGKTWDHCAILLCHVRGLDGDNFQPIQKALDQNRIPYVLQLGNSVSLKKPDVDESSEQHSFLEHVEFKDLLAYLRLSVNVNDDDAFLRALERPTRKSGLYRCFRQIDELYQKDDEVSSMYGASKKLIMASNGRSKIKILKDFIERIIPALQSAAARSVEETLNLIEELVKYRAFRRREKRQKTAANRRERMKRYRHSEVQPQDVLLDMAIVFDKNFTGEHPVQQFLHWLSLGCSKESKLEGAVTLSSVYQAKGEFLSELSVTLLIRNLYRSRMGQRICGEL